MDIDEKNIPDVTDNASHITSNTQSNDNDEFAFDNDALARHEIVVQNPSNYTTDKTTSKVTTRSTA